LIASIGRRARTIFLKAFRRALAELQKTDPQRAQRVLLSLSDPTAEPIERATTKAAAGAWPDAP